MSVNLELLRSAKIKCLRELFRTILIERLPAFSNGAPKELFNQWLLNQQLCTIRYADPHIPVRIKSDHDVSFAAITCLSGSNNVCLQSLFVEHILRSPQESRVLFRELTNLIPLRLAKTCFETSEQASVALRRYLGACESLDNVRINILLPWYAL